MHLATSETLGQTCGQAPSTAFSHRLIRGAGTILAALALHCALASPAMGAAAFAYLTNPADNNVLVYDLAQDLVIANIDVGSYPQGSVLTGDANTLYVANSNSGTVSVIDTRHNEVTTTIAVDAYPQNCALSADGSKLYVPNANSKYLSVINTSTNEVTDEVNIGRFHAEVAVNPVLTRMYITNNGADDDGNSVLVLNTSNNSEVTRIDLGSDKYPYGITVSSDGAYVYVACMNADEVAVIDTSDNSIVTTVSVGDAPQGITILPDGSYVYVANYSDGTVTVIDTSDNSVSDTVTVGDNPQGLTANSDGSRVYVANHGDGTMSVIDTSDNSVADPLTVGGSPVAMGNFVGEPTELGITVDHACVRAGTVSDDDSQIVNCASNSDSDVCQGEYATGSTVDLTVTPNDGVDFSHWTGDCSGTATTISVLLDRAKTCEAVFAPCALVVPTLTEWGLIFLGLGLAMAALWRMRALRA